MKLDKSYLRGCILLSCGVLFLQSCFGPDCGNYSETQYNFDQDDTIHIPYSGNDTLYFVNHVGDTFIAIGKGKRESTTTVPTTGDPDCGYNTDTYYAYDINFTDKSFRYSFGHSKKQSSNEIKLVVNNVSCSFSADYFRWKYDSILVNNKMYYKVLELKPISDNGAYYPENYLFYYCQDYGLIQFSGSTNGVLWSRLDK